MDEDQLQCVRENLAEDELREREQRQTLRREVLAIAECDDAINTATYVAMLGTIPSIVCAE